MIFNKGRGGGDLTFQPIFHKAGPSNCFSLIVNHPWIYSWNQPVLSNEETFITDWYEYYVWFRWTYIKPVTHWIVI